MGDWEVGEEEGREGGLTGDGGGSSSSWQNAHKMLLRK